VIGHYENMDPNITSFSLRVLNDKDVEILKMDTLLNKGKFSFTTREPGMYRVCFSANTGDGTWHKGAVKKARFSIRLLSGEVHNYDDLANKQHLSQLQVLIVKFMDHCEDFIKMQERNREQESVAVEVSLKSFT
jgi:hypothetical protein